MAADAMSVLPAAFFHAETDALRFWVPMPDQAPMGAIISRRVLQHRFQGSPDGSDALATYTAHRDVIDAAVARRAAEGAREPVMLREHDLPWPPR
jgi:hypothetical protein